MSETLHPELEVDLSGLDTRPVTKIAMVRRALQKAGFNDHAREFSNEALGLEHEEIVPMARRFVTVVM